MKEFTIMENDSNQRLDRFIGKAVPLLPSSLLQKYIRTKRIKVNGKGAKREYRLIAGDTVQLYINDEFFAKPSDENSYLKVSTPNLEIVYEDENILLVDKKPGVLVHSAAGEWSYNTLIAHIQAYLFSSGQWDPKSDNSFAPALCNRIDRNTGGIVIAAKNAEAMRIMNEKIKNREIDKYYLCIVHGRPDPASGTLQGYLFKDSVKNRVYIKNHPVPGAKSAVTRYKTLAVKNGLSLLECELLTGRTHQIRAQLAAAGYPLLGDGKYGSNKDNKNYGEKGQMLYSYKLKFNFTTPSYVLEYLNGREFCVQKIYFAEKYFDYYFND